ncbi:MAG TPA: FAD/NAD(P)-binding oxidoreductase [Paucimonas sp.]|nr:FAD/NAD(P)-binding oxidoreductase [Paucimonas sp.]
MRRAFDIVIIGAGPAGMAAAQAAAASGAAIAVVDDNVKSGGQIWRGGPDESKDGRAIALWSALREARNVEFFSRTRICAPLDGKELLAETPDGALILQYGTLILATGARERLLPFPGWTLPGVTGAGGLQALSKGGYPVAGKRVVVAGSGPLLLAVAATLKIKGAEVVAIFEQAPWHRVARFGLSLALTPGKLKQAMQLRATLSGVPYRAGSHVVAAKGKDVLEKISVMQGGRRREIDCDYLACGYGLIPNVELASALGCATIDGAVRVDGLQRTSVPDVFCAGEGTGVGGVDLSLVEGKIAGLAAAQRSQDAEPHFAERERWRAFARRLERAFALRPDLRSLCEPDTIVCRCEDVAHRSLASHPNWRSAKLHTRCGMGPCQGRICGGATGFLYGWTQDSIRMPLSPTRIGSLLAGGEAAGTELNAAAAGPDTPSA